VAFDVLGTALVGRVFGEAGDGHRRTNARVSIL
jgi:hypothetical protein